MSVSFPSDNGDDGKNEIDDDDDDDGGGGDDDDEEEWVEKRDYAKNDAVGQNGRGDGTREEVVRVSLD